MISTIFEKLHWSVWVFALPLILQATVLRKRGCYAYREFVLVLIILATAIQGPITLFFIRLFGKGHENFCHVSGYFMRTATRIFLGVDATVEGRENFLGSDQPAIYLCNHQTKLDLHFMSYAFPQQASIVVKKSIKQYPIFGWFMVLMKSVFVDRNNGRENAIDQARQVAAEMKRLGTSLYVFPEGTRSGGSEITLLPFKKGVFHIATQAKVPIVPIVVANYNHIYDTKNMFFGHGSIRIKVLPAISTKDVPEDLESIASLATSVRAQMLATLKELSISSESENDKTL